MMLKDGVTLGALTHKVRHLIATALIIVPGRTPICLRCRKIGHIRRQYRVHAAHLVVDLARAVKTAYKRTPPLPRRPQTERSMTSSCTKKNLRQRQET